MIQEGIFPNLLTYSSLIFGLADKGLMIEANQLFDDMLKGGITPDYMLYDFLVRGYLKQDDVAAITRLNDEMRNRGLFVREIVTGEKS